MTKLDRNVYSKFAFDTRYNLISHFVSPKIVKNILAEATANVELCCTRAKKLEVDTDKQNLKGTYIYIPFLLIDS